MTVLLRTLFWRILALLFILLAVIGMVLPVMPTVPFLIAALWAANKGWSQLESYLINHSRYGADIKAWRDNKVIKPRSKIIALTMIATGYGALWWFFPQLPYWLKGGVAGILIIVSGWLATRPSFVTNENKSPS